MNKEKLAIYGGFGTLYAALIGAGVLLVLGIKENNKLMLEQRALIKTAIEEKINCDTQLKELSDKYNSLAARVNAEAPHILNKNYETK